MVTTNRCCWTLNSSFLVSYNLSLCIVSPIEFNSFSYSNSSSTINSLSRFLRNYELKKDIPFILIL